MSRVEPNARNRMLFNRTGGTAFREPIVAPTPVYTPPPAPEPSPETSEDELSLNRIIEGGVPVKDVREFFKINLAEIRSPDDIMFGHDDSEEP